MNKAFKKGRRVYRHTFRLWSSDTKILLSGQMQNGQVYRVPFTREEYREYLEWVAAFNE